MRKPEESSVALTEHWIGIQDGWRHAPTPRNPEEDGDEDPDLWQGLFREAGIIILKELGRVKAHILDYVWKAWKRDRLPSIHLIPDRLSQNKQARLARESGSHAPRGYSPRTYRRAIQELISDGFLIPMVRSTSGTWVIPAWSSTNTSDPKATLETAMAKMIHRKQTRVAQASRMGMRRKEVL